MKTRVLNQIEQISSEYGSYNKISCSSDGTEVKQYGRGYFSQKTNKHTPQFLAGKIQWTIDTVQSNQICIELSMLLKSYWHDSPSPTKSCEFSYMHIVYYMMTDLHVYMYTF